MAATDRRSYRLAPHLEIILPREIAAADGKRKFGRSEIVQVLIDPDAAVRVYRQDETKGVSCSFREIEGAEIVRRLGYSH